MIFNSLTFFIFFVLFFAVYWNSSKLPLRFQNLLLLVASYIFYVWADWRFLAYLVGTSVLNFYLGLAIVKYQNTKLSRWIPLIGLIQGIGGLAFFKYFNFFVKSFNEAFEEIGLNLHFSTINLIIPLGISFFTFKTISYILDIKNGKLEPTRDWIIFLSYVAFFPTILSGPIDKAITFIPQLERKRYFNYEQASTGLKQILWGLFKKIVIADNCAHYTDYIFGNYGILPASTLVLGAFLYAIQMYSDFSGYSDMAIGISRLLGFNITINFHYPFFAQNIAEYWRRWHISLTAWLTEYVYTPLSIALRNYGKYGIILAIVLNFTICGIWHGANWTYVLFGFLHGLYFIPVILKGKLNKRKTVAINKLFPSPKEFFNIAGTLFLAVIAFIIFRSESVGQAFGYYSHIFSPSILSMPTFKGQDKVLVAVFIIVLFIVEWLNRDKEFALQHINIRLTPLRWAVYYCMIFFIVKFSGDQTSFIYIQF